MAEEREVHVFDVRGGQFVPASSGTGPYRDSPVFNEIDESYRPQQA
jgi:carbonic anhydrase